MKKLIAALLLVSGVAFAATGSMESKTNADGSVTYTMPKALVDQCKSEAQIAKACGVSI